MTLILNLWLMRSRDENHLAAATDADQAALREELESPLEAKAELRKHQGLANDEAQWRGGQCGSGAAEHSRSVGPYVPSSLRAIPAMACAGCVLRRRNRQAGARDYRCHSDVSS